MKIERENTIKLLLFDAKINVNNVFALKKTCTLKISIIKLTKYLCKSYQQ